MWPSVQKLTTLHILNFFKVYSEKTRPEGEEKEGIYS